MVRGDLRDRFGLFGHIPIAQAVKLEEECRQWRVAEMRETIDRIHLHFIEQFDPRHRNPELDRRDYRADGTLDAVELAGRRGKCLRTSVKPDRQLGDHTERSLRADKQLGQVVAGRRLSRAPAGGDDPAIGDDDGQAKDGIPHRAVANRGRA